MSYPPEARRDAEEQTAWRALVRRIHFVRSELDRPDVGSTTRLRGALLREYGALNRRRAQSVAVAAGIALLGGVEPVDESRDRIPITAQASNVTALAAGPCPRCDGRVEAERPQQVVHLPLEPLDVSGDVAAPRSWPPVHVAGQARFRDVELTE